MRKPFLSCWLNIFLLFFCLLSFSTYAANSITSLKTDNTTSTQTDLAKTGNTTSETTVDQQSHLSNLLKNPNVAYILLLIGIYGLFFEFYNPGLILPGVLGGISLLLALYAFQLFPVNYVGFALLLLGIAFMIIEVLISSFGILGVGGIVAFITGSILLLDINQPGYQIAWSLIAIMTVFTIFFFAILISLAIRASRKKIITGSEALIGSEGEITKQIDHIYLMKLHGETWQAECETSLSPGQKVRVLKLSGLILTVQPVTPLITL